MSSARIAAAAGSAAIALGSLAAGAVAQTAQPDTRPPCAHALVAMEDTIDSARAKPGDVFRYRLVENAVAPDGTVLPVGTLGYGVVANASHANRGGQPGYLALETRFIDAGSGKHVAAIIDRANDEASAAMGASANAPGVLGYIPIVGYAVGGYDALHHGRDATIPRGTRIGVYLGDDNAMGTCKPLAHGESPPPAPVVTPPPAASAAPAAPPAATVSPSPSPRP